ncbi:hypothetical protein G4B88_027767 [Cannabis sativa]|uniref:Spt5 KOW domain-containing protein n=1 Tax=Cannabis sativa TaxID=3483 RepID=A0A7J6DXN0_CANSA|nr:hypothetical protein G4B88_027767 [Cannabis sativa]
MGETFRFNFTSLHVPTPIFATSITRGFLIEKLDRDVDKIRLKLGFQQEEEEGQEEEEDDGEDEFQFSFGFVDLSVLGKKDYGLFGVIGSGIRVFADDVVESSEVTTGVTKIGDYELDDLVLLEPEVSLVKLREIKCKIDRKNNVQDRFKNIVSVKDVVRIVEGPCRGKQGPVEHIYKGVLFIYDRHHLEHAGFICAKSQSCVAVVKEIVPLVMAMKINGLAFICEQKLYTREQLKQHTSTGDSEVDGTDAVRQVLSRYQLAEFELCVLGNLCPETVEEAIAMVPSIKVVGANKGGVVAVVEGLRGFVLFSQISSVSHLTYFPNCEAL